MIEHLIETHELILVWEKSEDDAAATRLNTFEESHKKADGWIIKTIKGSSPRFKKLVARRKQSTGIPK